MINEQIKVLIGDDTAEYGIKIASRLREYGFFAYTRKNDGCTMEETIIKENPDIVVTDFSMPGISAVELMKKFDGKSVKKPEFIIISQIRDDLIERQVIDGGASYFMAKPFEIENLCSVIRSMARKMSGFDEDELAVIVTDIIQGLGVPAHVKGYYYLRTAIISALLNDFMLNSVTKQLYPSVAMKYSTTSSRVERAIRHAIDIAWSRGNAVQMNHLLGNRNEVEGIKPTNSEFIALITDNLRLKYKSLLGESVRI